MVEKRQLGSNPSVLSLWSEIASKDIIHESISSIKEKALGSYLHRHMLVLWLQFKLDVETHRGTLGPLPSWWMNTRAMTILDKLLNVSFRGEMWVILGLRGEWGIHWPESNNEWALIPTIVFRCEAGTVFLVLSKFPRMWFLWTVSVACYEQCYYNGVTANSGVSGTRCGCYN